VLLVLRAGRDECSHAAAAAWLGGGARQQQLGSEAGSGSSRLARRRGVATTGLARAAAAAWPGRRNLGCPPSVARGRRPRRRRMAGPGRQVQQPKALNPTQIRPKHQCQMPARTLEQTRKPEIPSIPNHSTDQILGINSNPNL
jgi:hypothetical protein